MFYLVQIEKRLWVVERSRQDSSIKLEMIENIDRVEKFTLGDDSGGGMPFVEIFMDNGSILRSRFRGDEDLSQTAYESWTSTKFNMIEERKNAVDADFLSQSRFIQRKCFELNTELKFGPLEMRDNAEISVLVKYGDLWRRIHNDKLLIGIPLFNTSR